ncbi:zinc ribbon domain-containing protein [Methanolapillus millepedarum]|uniref:Zinc-ribbon domain-containing protein n=1 Tax=Methanolapillus millepedarum TaxID=3028296 RepID=A0AA96V5Z3_9EURY|nr:hypothetical protein MsAc7_16870 [Methanosarcinaceae archaeon Ac7]
MPKYCANCGNAMDSDDNFCQNCGAGVGAAAGPEEKKSFSESIKESWDNFISQKEPFVAAIFSVFMSGLGQLYNGEFAKAVCVQVASIVLSIIGIFIWPILLAALAVWIWSVYDAYKIAEKMKIGKMPVKIPKWTEIVIYFLWPFLVIGFIVIIAFVVALMIGAASIAAFI